MSHFEEHQFNPQVKNISKKKNQKSISFVDYVEDTKREESLIGLQYVVEIKMLESDKSVVKCNLCNVKGQMSTMKEHLVGTNHIKLYMEKHYFSVLQSLKRSSQHKPQFPKLLKDYAKEIERAEGTRHIKIEYVSAADMKQEQETWLAQQEESLELHVDQKKFQVLDKRQMALNYSEKFKIASREEATIVLNLTQQLSDQLERYFLKFKSLDIMNSTTPDSISTTSTPAPSTSSIVQEKLYPKSNAIQDLKEEIQWHTEEPSSSVCTPTRINLFDRVPMEDTRVVKRKPEVSEDTSHQYNVLPENNTTSGFQRRKRRRHKEHHDFPTINSSSISYMSSIRSPQHSSTEVSSHSSSIVTTYGNISKEKSCGPEMFGGEMHIVKDAPQNSISQNDLNDNLSKIEAVQEIESQNGTDTADSYAAKNTSIAGPSSSTTSCSFEPSSERPPSSQAQGKTSKTLSPDILQLLKGKDANTVTNILRTLSPFYPALQDVNIEILAQVLVNTGALD